MAVQQHTRRAIGSYESYPQAQEAVDSLADRSFPVERLAIVGQDLRFIEQVTGRLGYGRAALQGLASGALTGALIGFVFGLFSVFDPVESGLVLALYGFLVGAVAGLVFGLIGHALSGGRRDFSSVSAVQAGRYEVLAEDDVAEEALRLLGEHRPR